MDEISVKGKTFVKAKVIARELGYTTDYIGQLCRSGKIDAELVGRTWYADPDSVRGHKKTRYRKSKTAASPKLASEVKKHRDEKNTAVGGAFNFYTYQPVKTPAYVQYETDETDLLPTPKKPLAQATAVELPVELADAKSVVVENNGSKSYKFESIQPEKPKFYGTLEVTEYMTEVPVGGAEEKAKRVKIHKSEKVKRPVLKPFQVQKEQEGPKHLATFKPRLVQKIEAMDRVKPAKKRPERDSVAVPVLVDEEEVSLPVTYHFITAGAFLGGLAIAAMTVGFEVTVEATTDSISTAYAFTVTHLEALIYSVR